MVMSKDPHTKWLETPAKKKQYLENYRWYETHDAGVIQNEWQHESQFRIEEDEDGS